MYRTFTILFEIAWNLLSAKINSGYEPPSQPPRGPQRQYESASKMAVATLVCGILSWTLAPFVAGLVGIVIGKQELNAIERGESPESGKTLTLVGWGLSLASVLLTILGGCVSVVIAIFFAGLWAAMLGALGLSGLAGG